MKIPFTRSETRFRQNHGVQYVGMNDDSCRNLVRRKPILTEGATWVVSRGGRSWMQRGGTLSYSSSRQHCSLSSMQMETILSYSSLVSRCRGEGGTLSYSSSIRQYCPLSWMLRGEGGHLVIQFLQIALPSLQEVSCHALPPAVDLRPKWTT